MNNTKNNANILSHYQAMNRLGKVLRKKRVVIPGRFAYLESVRDLVLNFCESADFSEDNCYRVKLAIDEACTNVIEHAYGGETEQLIECVCIETTRAVIIQLFDEGKNFDPQLIPEPNLHSELQDRELGGLGLHFIKMYMDDVIYQDKPVVNIGHNTSLKGNYLLLVKLKEK